jgi:hypothetical protein
VALSAADRRLPPREREFAPRAALGAATVAAACSELTSPRTPLKAEPSLPPDEMLRGMNEVLQR